MSPHVIAVVAIWLAFLQPHFFKELQIFEKRCIGIVFAVKHFEHLEDKISPAVLLPVRTQPRDFFASEGKFRLVAVDSPRYIDTRSDKDFPGDRIFDLVYPGNPAGFPVLTLERGLSCFIHYRELPFFCVGATLLRWSQYSPGLPGMFSTENSTNRAISFTLSRRMICMHLGTCSL